MHRSLPPRGTLQSPRRPERPKSPILRDDHRIPVSVVNIDDLRADHLEVPYHGSPVRRAVPVLRGRDDPLAGRLQVVYARRSTGQDILHKALPRPRAVLGPHQHAAVAAPDQRDIAPDPALVVDGKL